MSTVKQKYLKDENGDIFSPIVGDSSVILGGGYPSKVFYLKDML